MKKAIKILLALLLASAMVLVVAACTPKPTPPTPPTPSQDACEQNGHSWEITSTIQPTCGTDGKVVYTCSVCKTTQERSIPALGSHSWDDGQVTKQPTCSEDGERTFTCTNDGCTETYTEPIPATGVHTKGDHVPEVAATCQTEGHREYWLCQTCSAKLDASGAVIYSESSLVIAKLAHTYDDGTRTEPTCEAPGSIVYTCTTCDPALGPVATITKTIPQKGHNYGRLVAEEPAGCLSTGFAAHYYCEDCHKYFTADRTETSFENLVINATGHNPQKVEGKAPTCEEDGFQAYFVCQNCHLLFAEQDCQVSIAAPKVLRATGHNVVQIPEESPDCTHSGKSEGTRCSTCGKVFTAPKTLAPLGHDWGDWQYTNPADRETCTESGVQHRFCKRCTVMDTQTNTVPALGHNWDEWYTVQDATCLQDGIQHRDCARCGETDAEVDYLPKLNHLWGDWRYLRDDDKPTCTKDGVLRRTCQRDDCGTIDTQTQSVPALGHKYTFDKFNWSNSNTQANAVFLCGNERCPEPKKEVAADVVVDEQTDYTNYKATATFQGQTYTETKTVEHNHDHKYFVPDGGWNWSDDFSSAKVTFDCSVCTGDPHTLDAAVKKDVQPATCTKDGLETYTATASYGGVSATDVKTKVLPATGHTKDESQHTEYKAATCTEPGNVEYWICKGCGKKLDKDDNVIEEEKITIAALGHEFKEIVEAQDPTCTEPGHKAYWQCERCHLYFAENDKQTSVDYEKDLETAATGHQSDRKLHTDKQKRTHYYECTVCQAHLEETACNVPETYHYNTEQHWHECTVCNQKYDVVKHGEFTYESLKDQPGQHKVFCGVCKEFVKNEECTPEAGDAGLAEGWHANEDNHWQVCSKCTHEYGRAPHEFKNGTSCSTCGKEVSAVLVEFDLGEQKTTHGVVSVEAAFKYILEQGAQGPFIVTLKQNCTEDALIAPEGAAVSIHVGTFTFQLNKLTIKANSNLYVVVEDKEGKEGTFTCQEIYYHDVAGKSILSLPAGDYTFHFAEGITCDKAAILVGLENIQHQWTYSDCSWPTEYNGEEQLDVTFNLSCSVCSAKHSEQAKATKDAEQSQAAGCTENGKAVFHASVEYSGKQLTADKEYTINALGHKYDGKTYKTENWQHDRVCDNCSQPEGKPVACTPENNTCKDCGHTYSVDEILTRFQKESSLPGTYELTGIIESFNQDSNKNTYIYITISGETETMSNVECFKIDLNGKKIEDICVGARIKVSGELYTYNNKQKEFNQGCKLISIEYPEYSVDLNENFDKEVKVEVVNKANVNSDVTVTVTLSNKYSSVILSVKDSAGQLIQIIGSTQKEHVFTFTFKMPGSNVEIEIELFEGKGGSVIIENTNNDPFDLGAVYANSNSTKTVGCPDDIKGIEIHASHTIYGNKANNYASFQMKYNTTNNSELYNSTAFPGKIVKITITWAYKTTSTDSSKSGKANLLFGTSTSSYTKTEEIVNTDAGSSVTIVLGADENFTYFKITSTQATIYISSIQVFYNICLHTQLTKVEEKSPTCTENGYATYWKCDLCNKLFSDEDCQTEIKEPQTAGFEYTGHKWKVDESVNGDGWTWTDKQATLTLECETCHQKLVLDASISSEAPTAPKCDTDGYTVYNAKVTKPEKGAHGEVTVTEKDAFDSEDYSSTKNLDPTSKLEHKQNGQYAVETWKHCGENQHKGQCTLCGKEIIENCGDIKTFEVKSGDGKHWRECPTCHYHYEENVHTFQDGVCTYPGCDAKAENVGVIIGAQETKYQTLADALQHVTGDVTATVKLYNDSSEATLNIPNSGDVTLDLNSHTLTVTSEIVVTGGTLTIKGGTLNATIVYSGSNSKKLAISNVSEYTLKLSGVKCNDVTALLTIDGNGISHAYTYSTLDNEQAATKHNATCGYCDYTETQDHHLKYSNTDGTTHDVTCTDGCGYIATGVAHSYNEWQPVGEEETSTQHTSECVCGHSETKDHNWEVNKDTADDSGHEITCSDCNTSRKVGHTFDESTPLVRKDELQHSQTCKDCQYEVVSDHLFSDGKDCVCGEPMCGEHTLSLTNDSNQTWNFGAYDSSASTQERTIDGVKIAVYNVAYYSNVKAPFQMRKDSASYISNVTALKGGIRSIAIEWSGNGSSNGSGTIQLVLKTESKIESAAYTISHGAIDSTTTINDKTMNGIFHVIDRSDYVYFTLTATKGTSYIKSITIEYFVEHVIPDPVSEKTGCVENGSKTGTCVRCQEVQTTATDPIGHHVWEFVKSEPATCQTPAYVDQWQCTQCHRYFRNYSETPPKATLGDSALSDDRIVDETVNGGKPVDHKWEYVYDEVNHPGEHQRQCVWHEQCQTVDIAWTDHDIKHDPDAENPASGHYAYCETCGWKSSKLEQHTPEGGPCGSCNYGHNDNFFVDDIGYPTLAEAIEYLDTATVKTISIKADQTDVGGTITADFTLDLGSKTLTLTGTLTISGNVTIKNGTISGGALEYLISTSGATELNNVTIDGNKTTQAAVQLTGGILTLSGATLIGPTRALEYYYNTPSDYVVLKVDALSNFLKDKDDKTNTGLIEFVIDGVGSDDLLLEAYFSAEQKTYPALKITGADITCESMLFVVFNSTDFESGTSISHTYLDQKDGNHKCDICSKSEVHSLAWTNNGDEGHTEYCTVCDYNVEEQHDFSKGDCECGAVGKQYFVKVTKNSEIVDGDYLIVCENRNKAFNGGVDTGALSSDANAVNITIANSKIEAKDTTKAYIVTITKNPNGTTYAIRSKSQNYYITFKDDTKMGNSNSAKYYELNIDSSQNFEIIFSSTCKRRLQYSDSGPYFRYYTPGTNYDPIQLYKLS